MNVETFLVFGLFAQQLGCNLVEFPILDASGTDAATLHGTCYRFLPSLAFILG